ncbi:putative F420-dependent oxidoreductase [Actinoplanes lutulentus]|uniref:LLM class flavin-dependent oxidoreductase n=1 Tax=Actinoplanes lutulentus TaxID=1287878 RepID=UPI000DB98688|nr:LLM class flavin-dependent oxidoreductase [Actinoplanes lutulentus]MBB2943205.1 putative F420-dependent oxidoreductase [Actinoplanes lutulentus]
MTVFSLQAQPTDASSWLALARRAEELGFGSLLAADHPGSSAAPFVALAAAAAVTSRLRLGSNVTNTGVREAAHIATDAATLDVVSGGRAIVGLGAGHTPAEWQAIGRERPDVRGRVDRCLEVARAVRELLDGGLASPRPVQERVPMTIGTANSRLLHWAGGHADIVGLSGLGRTLEDGHRHEARWRTAQIDHQVERVVAGAAGRSSPFAVEALVQIVEVTDDAEKAAAPHAELLGMPVAELLDAPFVMIGTVGEIRGALQRHEKRWGITRYVIREPGMEAVAALIE